MRDLINRFDSNDRRGLNGTAEIAKGTGPSAISARLLINLVTDLQLGLLHGFF